MSKVSRRVIRNNVSGYCFALPSIICLMTFVIVPIIMAVYYSFTTMDGAFIPVWSGLKNYKTLFADPQMKTAIKNSLLYVVIAVPAQTIISLILSVILAQNFQNRFGEMVRSTLFVPVVCSATLVATVWYYMFSKDPSGLVNLVCSFFGAEPKDWLGKGETAFFVICFVNIWKSIGYYLVIFYAGVMDIPKNLYEAAELDGASKIQQFIHIILPNLKSVTAMVVTLCTINSFQVFEITYMMTNGGPGFSTTSLIHQIYMQGFRYWKFGYASAAAMIMLVLILVITFVERKLFNEKAADE